MTKRTNNILWSIGVVLLLGWSGMSLAVSPPERINFQGVLRDASGAPVADGKYAMGFQFFGNGAGACDCGEVHLGSAGCTDATCEADVCAIDPFCCDFFWDLTCTIEAEQFASCQACIADEDVLFNNHGGFSSVAVTGGLFNVALGSSSLIDGLGAGTYLSLGAVFRDFDVVYVETQVNGEVLSPRIRVEGSAYTQNALQLEGKRAAEFIDTSATLQTKAGDLEVQGDVTVGGDVLFSDGSVQVTAFPADPPCFDLALRFVDCGNGTVTDTVTGLIWLQDASCATLPGLGGETGNYVAGNEAAASLQDGDCGLTDRSSPGDWRLPTKAEWQTIIDQANTNGCGAPFFPDTLGTGCCGVDPCAFAGVQSDFYWSSTTLASSPNGAWDARLVFGSVGFGNKTFNDFVWPVRAGP